MRKLLTRINSFFAMLCGWLMLLLMILLIVDFVGRSLPKIIATLGAFMDSQSLVALSKASWLQPMTFLADLSVFFMIIAVYLGLALCEERDQHVQIEILTSKLRGAARDRLAAFTGLLQVITVSIMVYALYKNTLRSHAISEAISGMVPLIVWPVKACALCGLLLYWVQVVVGFCGKVQALFTPNAALVREE